MTRAEEQVRSFEGLHAAVEERYKQHEQQRQQQQQQQAQQQAQKQAQQQAPLMMGGMAIDPMVLAGMAGQLGIAMPNVPNPMGMMMGMPQMPQMPQMPMGMVPVPMPGMGQAGGAGAGAMPGGVVPMPGMGAAPQPGVAGAGQGQGQAAASDFRGSLGAGVSGNGMGGGGGGGGTGVAGPSGGGEGGMGMGGASPSLAGGQFGLSDDIAAQLAAHLQSTNHDALATLAKSLAEFNGTVRRVGAAAFPSTSVAIACGGKFSRGLHLSSTHACERCSFFPPSASALMSCTALMFTACASPLHLPAMLACLAHVLGSHCALPDLFRLLQSPVITVLLS